MLIKKMLRTIKILGKANMVQLRAVLFARSVYSDSARFLSTLLFTKLIKCLLSVWLSSSTLQERIVQSLDPVVLILKSIFMLLIVRAMRRQNDQQCSCAGGLGLTPCSYWHLSVAITTPRALLPTPSTIPCTADLG